MPTIATAPGTTARRIRKRIPASTAREGYTLLADHEQRSFVLRIDLPVWADRKRRVRRAESLIEEDVRPQRPTLIDRVQIAVFAVGIHDAVDVDHWSIDAPLEPDVRPLSAGGVWNAGERVVRVSRAALVVRVLELPLDVQAGIELGDEERTVLPRRTDRVDVAVRPELRTAAVLVVLDDDRVRRAMLVDGRRGIPAEGIRAEELSVRVELQQVAAAEVVARVGAVEQAAIRSHCYRRGRIVEHARRRSRVLRRVYTWR